MAISYVGSTTAGSSNGADFTLNLTTLTGGSNSSPSEGDVVVIACGAGSTGSRTASVSGSEGYTELSSALTSDDTYDTGLRVYYKVLGASPDTSISCIGTGNASDANGAIAMVFRGANTVVPFSITPTSNTGVNSGQPDPASITPTSPGSWVIAAGAAGLPSGSSFTTSDMTLIRSGGVADTNNVFIGLAYYSGWTSGSFNPTQWGGGSTSTQASNCALTFVLEPGGPVMTASSSSFTLSGTSNSLLKGFKITADNGSLTLSGTVTNFLLSRLFSASSGTFNLTGTNVSFNFGKTLSADTGVFSLTGIDNSFRRTYILSALTQAFNLTNTSAGLYKGFKVSAASGAFTLTGVNTGLNKGFTLSTTNGTYLITGVAASLIKTLIMSLGSGTFQITGEDGDLSITETIIIDCPRRSFSSFQSRSSASSTQFRGSRSRRDLHG